MSIVRKHRQLIFIIPLALLVFVCTFIVFRELTGRSERAEHNSEVLNATCGPLRGNIYRHGEKVVDGYLGIPFAKPPIGSLRFKKPVAAEKWAEPRDCYQYGPGCPQSGNFGRTLPDSLEFAEDNCLTVNVFAPRSNSTEFPKGLPVMVYFYGGGFEVGFSSFFNDYILTGTLPLKDVVVVTVNYRVGPLGFLTTGDDVARGNYGLWDQTLALKWVQEHIASFGGDPGSVTIFGTSAGGASADFLALSPHSNELFHRFIASSGTAFCDFAIRTRAEEARIFRDFAKHHGYSGEDSESLLKWYESQPSSKFRETEDFQSNASGFLFFVPNLDDDFFPKPLDELRKEAPMDVIVTVGEYEGLGWNSYNPEKYENVTENFEAAIATAFGPDLVENPEEVRRKILEFYLEEVDATDKEAVTRKLIEFIGDSWFNIGALDAVKSCAKYGSSAYLASFDYFNPNVYHPKTDNFAFLAASHGSELKYIMGQGYGEFDPNEEEFQVMDMMGNFVTNFAKYGNPNGKEGPEVWEKYSLSQPNRYFKIDYPKSEMRENFQNGRMRIYEDINETGKKYQEIVYGNKL